VWGEDLIKIKKKNKKRLGAPIGILRRAKEYRINLKKIERIYHFGCF
jgi:hypothetical protein